MSPFVLLIATGVVLLAAAAAGFLFRAVPALPFALRRPQLQAGLAIAGIAAVGWAFLVAVPAERDRERQALVAEYNGNLARVAELEEMIDGLLLYIEDIKWEIHEQTAVIERDGDRGAVERGWLEEATYRLSRAESQLLGSEDAVVKYQIQIRDAETRNATIRGQLRQFEP